MTDKQSIALKINGLVKRLRSRKRRLLFEYRRSWPAKIASH